MQHYFSYFKNFIEFWEYEYFKNTFALPEALSDAVSSIIHDELDEYIQDIGYYADTQLISEEMGDCVARFIWTYEERVIDIDIQLERLNEQSYRDFINELQHVLQRKIIEWGLVKC